MSGSNCCFFRFCPLSLHPAQAASEASVVKWSTRFISGPLGRLCNFFNLLWLQSKSDSKKSACNAGYSGSIPGLGRSPEEGNGNPLWYSCLRNPMNRGTWWATGSQSQTQLNNWTHTHNYTLLDTSFHTLFCVWSRLNCKFLEGWDCVFFLLIPTAFNTINYFSFV